MFSLASQLPPRALEAAGEQPNDDTDQIHDETVRHCCP